MDYGHTYATESGERAMLYVTDDFTAPERIELSRNGETVIFSRVLPSSLYCGDVPRIPGSCGSDDCHRIPLGYCKCGRHGTDADGNPVRVPFVRAVR